MYIDADTVIKVSSLIAAIIAILVIVRKTVTWIQAQEKQTADIQAIMAEQCLLTYAVLACLKGLKEQGCDGPVEDAIDKVEKHINQKAHDQK